MSSFQKFALAVALALVAAGCSGNTGASAGRTSDNSSIGPYVDLVQPGKGPPAGGTVVLIKGERFSPEAKVKFGIVESPKVVVADGRTLTAVTPEGAVGVVDVTVLNPEGVSSTLAQSFSYEEVAGDAPTLARAVPATGPVPGGSLIELSGTGFMEGALAFVGGRPATNVTVISPTLLTLVTPAGVNGPAELAITNPDGHSAVLADGFSYYPLESAQRPPPRLAVIDPAQGSTLGGDQVYLSGSDFVPGIRVYFGGHPADRVALEAARLAAVTPTGKPGVADVYVTNPDGQSSSLHGFNFYEPMPILSRIEPVSGPLAGGTAVTLHGRNFTATSTASIGGRPLTDVKYVDPQTLTGVTPRGDMGGWQDTQVINGSARDTLPGSFFYSDADHPDPGGTSARLVVTRAVPVSHPVAGGTTMTLTGAGFQVGLTVTVNGAPATDVKVLGATAVTLKMPAGKAGPAVIEVTNPDKGTAKLEGVAFYFGASTSPAPKLTSVLPALGPTVGGTRVVINGQNFQLATKVLFGTAESTHTRVMSDTQLTADAPAGVAGTVAVSAVNPDGQADTLPSAFTYFVLGAGQSLPQVASIAPSSGSATAETAVTITGQNFQTGAQVFAGDFPASKVTVASATSITATLPPGAAGLVDIVVVNPDGTTGKLTAGFEYKQLAPKITSVSPGTGPLAGQISVLLVGENFTKGATVSFGSTASTDVRFVDGTVLRAVVPPGTPGKVDVTVTNADGQKGNLAAAFEYDPNWVASPAPKLTDVLPAKGPEAGGSLVYLKGSNFTKGGAVFFGDARATEVTVVDDKSASAVTPPGTKGPVHVTWVNGDGQLTVLTAGFTYLDAASLGPKPEVTSVSPTSGRESMATPVVLAGKNFASGAFVFFGGALGENPSLVSASAYGADAPPHAPGLVDVALTSADGQTSFLRQSFTYVPRPQITTAAPSGGTTSGGTKVVLTGTGFQAGATVAFGTKAAASIIVRGATTIEATTAAAPAGAVDIVVTNPDKQTGTLAQGFVFVGPPGIDAGGVNPGSGPQTGGTIAIVKGSGFVAGSTVTVGGKSATAEVIDANTLVMEVPAGTGTGSVDVVVHTPDGQGATAAQAFTYKDPTTLGPAPSITAVTPAKGPLAGATLLTVSGKNFSISSTGSGGALLFFGLRPATGVQGISSSLLAGKTPAGASVGTVAVAVTNSDGQTVKLADAFEYLDASKLAPAPTLASLVPDKATIFGGSTINATGTNFDSGSTFFFGGRPADAATITSATAATLTAPVGNPGAAEVAVTSADGQTAVYKGSFEYIVPAPEPLVVSPNSGTTRGGTTITVGGRNFQSGAEVTVGGGACTAVNVVDPSSITCVTPAGVDGPAVVRVINADGKASSLANGFNYFSPPEPLLVSPNNGSASGGTVITIAGRAFQSGATVTVGGNACTSVKFVDSGTLTCTTPAGVNGPAAVAVTNPDNHSATLAAGFTYVTPPEPLVVSPNSGTTKGGTKITVSGRSFQSGATVTVGGNACLNVTFVDASSLTCTTPVGVDGPAAVQVTNAPGYSATLATGFTYVAPPDPQTASPSVGPQSGGTLLTIKGAFFRTGVLVNVGGVPCAALTRVSDTELSCTTPAGSPGSAVITVTNTDGQTGNLSGAFTYEPALGITRISPPTGPDKGGITVTVFGNNFKAGAVVTLGGTAATSVKVLDAATLTFTLPSGLKGLSTLTVTNTDGGRASLAGAFSYYDSTSSGPIPTLSRIAPTVGPVAGGTRVQLGGSNFAKGVKVYLGGVEMNGPRLLDATLIVGETPSATVSGPVPVTVMNPDGRSDTLFAGFNYYVPNASQKAPVVATVTPATGSTRTNTAVSLAGTDFATGALVYAGDVPATGVTVASATAISGTFPAQPGGTVDVVVVNPDGLVGRLNAGFQYNAPAPTLSGVRPARGPLSGNITALVLGDNFDRGATVTFGRTASTSVKYVDATALTATVPSGVAGKVDVTVTNLDGQSATLTQAFEYDPNWTAGPAPTVTSVQPPKGPTTGGSALLVRGTNFVAGATVLFADTAGTDVNIIDSSTLYVVTPAQSAGPAHVTVLNPDGQLGVLPGGFTYYDPSQLGPKPTVSGTSPTQGAQTASTTTLLTGSNFRTGGFVYFGGVPAANPVMLSSSIYQGDAQPHAPGPVDVAFTNADGTSAILRGGFTYVAKPSVASVTPNSGPTVGGTKILVTGEAFQGGASITVGGVAATAVNVRSATLLECVTPAGSSGLADVTVTNPDKQTATLAKGFLYVPPPSFSATPVNPATGPSTGGTLALVKGSNFATGLTVTVGGQPAVVELIDSNTITIQTPAGTVGFADVTVKNADGQFATASRAFSYKDPLSLGPAPQLSNITPVQGPLTGGTLAAISGGNYSSGALVFFGMRPATGVTYVAVDTLTGISPAGANLGPVQVAVTNPDGQTVKKANLFTYLDPANLSAAPALNALAPQTASVFGGSSISAGGANFAQGSTFFFAGRPASSTTINTTTSATTVAPPAPTGPASVAITGPDGQTAFYKGSFDYIVPPPSPLVVNPNTGSTRGGTAISIGGKNFQNGATVQISGAPCGALKVVDSTRIDCVTPAGVDGPAAVKVINADGQSSTLANGFTYASPPDPQKVSPTSGPVAGGTSINITGAFFASGCTVTIANKPCNNTNRVSSSLITCDVPAGTAGPAAVTVSNPDGQSTTLAAGFTYLPPVPPPTLTSVSPNYGSIRGGSGVTLIGTAFQSGAQVFFGQLQAPIVNVTSQTSIACNTPAQAAGNVNVTVRNPDGQTATIVNGYQYIPDAALPPISVSQISPSTGSTTGGTTLTITGNGFQAGLAITVGSQLCGQITRLGPTGLTCVTPAGAAGPVPVAVTNPDGSQVIVNNGFTYDQGGRYVVAGHNAPLEAFSNKRGAILVDVDKDNDLDLFTTNMNGGYAQPWLEMNNGSGVFSLAMQNLPPLTGTGSPQNSNQEPNQSWQVQYRSPIAVDMNKDGTTDLVYLNQHQVVVYLNDGGGVFTRTAFNICPDQSNGTRSADARGMTIGDFDRDGDLDIAVARGAGTVNCWSYAANAYVNINGEVLLENMSAPTTAIGTWDFENAVGSSSTPDSSGKNNTLTFGGAGATLTTSGHSGQALQLSGTTTGFATLADNASLNPQTITISAWIYQTGNATQSNTIVRKENQYALTVNNGQLQMALWPQNGPSWSYVGAGTVPLNTWTNVMATYDGVAIRLFVNGVQTSYTAWSYGPINVTTNTLYVGKTQSNTEFFAGKIDELRIVSGSTAPSGAVNLMARYTKIPQIADDSRAIASGDFDKDGDLDLIVVNDSNHQNRLYYNDGFGNFSDVSSTLLGVSGGICYDVAVGDMDKDGDLDIFVARNGQRTLLYANDGNGKFTDVTLTSRLQADLDAMDTSGKLLLLDIDNDSDLDLIVKKTPTTTSPQPLRIYRNDGVGFFAPDVADTLLPKTLGEAPLYDVAFGDMNKDGYLDMIWLQEGYTNRILLNDTTGKFAFKTLTSVPEMNASDQDAVAVDVDADGDQDLVVCGAGQPTKLFLNDGAGNYVDYTAARMPNVPLTCYDVDIADVNKDGAPDIFMTSTSSPASTPSGATGASVYLYINDGRGNFTDQTFPRLPSDATNRNIVGYTIEPIDYDGDGDLDLLVGNGGLCRGSSGTVMRLWENLSTNTGYYVDVTNAQPALNSLPYNGCCCDQGLILDIQVGKIDLDGLPDVFLARNSGGNQILFNSPGGKFTNVTTSKMASPINSRRAVMYDADGDGDMDIFVAAENYGSDKLYLNTGDGLYSDVSPSNLPGQVDWSVGAVVADADHDGRPDLILAKRTSGGRSPPRILMNIGSGKYQDYSSSNSQLLPTNGKIPITNDITNNVAKGFFNTDAFEDLIFLNTGQSRVFVNQP